MFRKKESGDKVRVLSLPALAAQKASRMGCPCTIDPSLRHDAPCPILALFSWCKGGQPPLYFLAGSISGWGLNLADGDVGVQHGIISLALPALCTSPGPSASRQSP